MNWVHGTAVGPGAVETDIGNVKVAGDRKPETGERLLLGIRPEDLVLDKSFSSASVENNVLVGNVISSTFLGDHRVYKVKVKDQLLTVKGLDQLEGEVGVRVPPHKVHLFSGPASNSNDPK
jgi:ABC-type sugar transport system ATPase subunit